MTACWQMLPVVPNPIYEYNKNASNASVHMAGGFLLLFVNALQQNLMVYGSSTYACRNQLDIALSLFVLL